MVKIDENTKVIARLHTKASPRGLNIYNPFFEEAGINALYVLFYNPDPTPLIEGIKNLNIIGAISAGFESNDVLPTLLDNVDEVGKYVGRIGFIKNSNGLLTGSHQGGEGLLRAIQKIESLANKKVILAGGGNIAKALLFNINKLENKPSEVILVNRTVSKIESVKSDFSFITEVKSLSELNTLSGDLLINATDIGGSVEDIFYTDEIVNKFGQIADVTFEKENTNLVTLAKKLNKKVSTGWDMFTFQGQVILESMLEIKIDPIMLKKHVVSGLSEVVV
jgi:shikimate 5-dehydrogenase